MDAGMLFESGERGRIACYCRVAVERGIDRSGALGAWDGLTYASAEAVEVGELVEAPLGRGGRLARGVVVRVGGKELLEGLSAGAVKWVEKRVGARLPEELVELGRWMAGYYVCPIGMAMSALAPAAVKARVGLRRMVVLDIAEPRRGTEGLGASTARAWERIGGLDAGVMPCEARALATAAGLGTLREVNALVRSGHLTAREVERVRATGAGLLAMEGGEGRGAGVELTAGQREAVEGIAGAGGVFGVHLLYGVTGSGKTEVYLRVIERVLAGGRTALVMVPEISLTPQASERYGRRLGRETVAVLHSGLSASQRHREWARASGGLARVVVGARSAVFAPLSGVGVIVVDEEHDGSYKQDQLPRYNGRDVAVKRGQLAGCPVVLGSATPSLESWRNAVEGRYRLWRLAGRVGGGRLPRVELVDMGRERRGEHGERRVGGVIGARLRGALRETLEAGGQAILLMNRRGWASYVGCASARCGWGLSCDHCDARMVVHVGGALPLGSVVRCHHCLSEQRLPAACPACGGRTVRLGAGTQRVEEELCREFAGGRVGERARLVEGETLVRVDSDTMGRGRAFASVLTRFARGEVRVLLGTQMIAKGLDFPGVSLVGVVSGDTGLSVPDFRSNERTFQLVSQVAGRAGRGPVEGLVIVQTFEPGSMALRHASGHDFEGFAREELAERARLGLPPATRMARVVVRDRDLDRCEKSAGAVAEAIGSSGRGVRVYGPGACPVSRIGGFHRVGVECVAGSARAIQDALREVRAQGLLKSDARTAVDVDPVSML